MALNIIKLSVGSESVEDLAAWQILPELKHRRLLPAEIMGRTYYEILQEIRARNYNVFTRRASLRRRDKLRVAALAIARAGLSGF